MRPSTTDALRIGLIVAACGMLATGAQGADPSTGLSSRDVAIWSVDAQDQQVLVTVVSPGLSTHKATVTFQVRNANGSRTAAANTVTLFGRQKAFVVLALGAPPVGAPVVGMIVDDPCPF